jgi:hypothetical protein
VNGENCIARSFIICTHRVVKRIEVIKSRRIRWAGHVAGMEYIRNSYTFCRKTRRIYVMKDLGENRRIILR